MAHLPCSALSADSQPHGIAGETDSLYKNETLPMLSQTSLAHCIRESCLYECRTATHDGSADILCQIFLVIYSSDFVSQTCQGWAGMHNFMN